MGAEHIGAVIIRRNKQMIQFVGTKDEQGNIEFYPKAKKPTSSSKLPSCTSSSCTGEPKKQPQMPGQ